MRRFVDEKLYWGVKTLLNGGATLKEAAEYFMLAENTVRFIRNSENLTEYRNMQAAMHAKYRKPKEPEKEPEKAPETPSVQTVTVQATPYMMEELRKQNELLALISNKLAFIVEQLA